VESVCEDLSMESDDASCPIISAVLLLVRPLGRDQGLPVGVGESTTEGPPEEEELGGGEGIDEITVCWGASSTVSVRGRTFVRVGRLDKDLEGPVTGHGDLCIHVEEECMVRGKRVWEIEVVSVDPSSLTSKDPKIVVSDLLRRFTRGPSCGGDASSLSISACFLFPRARSLSLSLSPVLSVELVFPSPKRRSRADPQAERNS
jgi:hypothetical protein